VEEKVGPDPNCSVVPYYDTTCMLLSCRFPLEESARGRVASIHELPRRGLLGNPYNSVGKKKGRGFYTPAGTGLDEVWLVRYLKEGDFVALYVRYRLITGIR
jgi:hypothetical protein